MRTWPTLNIQRLFGVALGLKVGFAAVGYVLGSPFWLGLVAPLTVMVAYMVVGYKTRDDDVSEEKFADSCYYLGFIFTIVSIVFCLFDIPKMSAGGGLQDIAVRFGAAMVSTVLGMGVRVYLVSFRKDGSDAMQDAEQGLLDSVRLFTAQLHENLKTLQSFEQQVVAAGQASVAGVQVQVEALARNFSQTLSQFYAQLNDENRAVFREMANEAKAASARLAEPLDQLALEIQGVGGAVHAVNDQVREAAVVLKATLGSLNAKLKTGATVMDGVIQMAERHGALLAASERQAETYSGFLDRLAQVESSLAEVVRTAGATSQASNEVLTRLAGVAADSVALREAVRTSLLKVAAQNAELGEAVRSSVMAVSSKLDSQAQATSGLLAKVDEHARRIEQGSGDVVQALKGHAEQVTAVNGRFEAMAGASQGLSKQLEAVVTSNAQLLDNSRKRLEGVDRAAVHSESIVVSLAQLKPLLSRHVEALQASSAPRPASTQAAGPLQGGSAPERSGLTLPADGWRASTQVSPTEPQPGQDA